jgi:hypothetical protein
MTEVEAMDCISEQDVKREELQDLELCQWGRIQTDSTCDRDAVRVVKVHGGQYALCQQHAIRAERATG